jgi:hypothetical protein
MDDTDTAAAVTFFPPMVSHLCLLSIVPFVNVERLAYSSIYVFKGCESVNGVLNMGGSGEDEGGGTSNDVAP